MEGCTNSDRTSDVSSDLHLIARGEITHKVRSHVRDDKSFDSGHRCVGNYRQGVGESSGVGDTSGTENKRVRIVIVRLRPETPEQIENCGRCESCCDRLLVVDREVASLATGCHLLLTVL